jgi:hypothetical protein
MSSSDIETRYDNNDGNDEAELARMGYKQELKRDLSMLQVR